MKKILIFIYLITLNLQAHSLLMNVIDNEDDTITVVGEFSTGELAVGALVRLEALNSGEILYKKRLPDSSELTFDIPKEPYQVVLDGGPGHQIVKDGIAPLDGFNMQVSKSETKKELSKPRSFTKEWSLAYIVLISLTLILIALSVYFSKRNTDKILRAIKEHS